MDLNILQYIFILKKLFYELTCRGNAAYKCKLTITAKIDISLNAIKYPIFFVPYCSPNYMLINLRLKNKVEN